MRNAHKVLKENIKKRELFKDSGPCAHLPSILSSLTLILKKEDWEV
jgi:hypothetical protein